MKQAELAKKLGISLSKLSHMTNSELKAEGWQKVGKGKGCFYRRLKQGNEEQPEPRSRSLKNQLTEAQIEKIRLQNEEERDKIREEYKKDVIELVMGVLSDVKKCVSELGLNEAQTKKLSECIDKSLKQRGSV